MAVLTTRVQRFFTCFFKVPQVKIRLFPRKPLPLCELVRPRVLSCSAKSLVQLGNSLASYFVGELVRLSVVVGAFLATIQASALLQMPHRCLQSLKTHRRSEHLGRGNAFFVLSQLVKHSEQMWMLEKVSSALNTTATIPSHKLHTFPKIHKKKEAREYL